MLHVLLLASLLGIGDRPEIPCPRMADGGITVDGFFLDWDELQGVRGSSTPDLDWELRAVRDSKRLYLTFGAKDDRFVPSGRTPAAGGDHLRLHFGPAAGRGRRRPSVIVLPGDLEERRPRLIPQGVKLSTGDQALLHVDGATRPGGGWILELALPLALLGPNALGPDGLEVTLEVFDADRGRGGAERASHGLRLTFPEWEHNLEILKVQLTLPPSQQPDLRRQADVGGDGREELVMVFGPVVAVLGEGMGKAAYYLYELPFAQAVQPERLELHDLTGDGKRDLLVRYSAPAMRDSDEHTQSFLTALRLDQEGLTELITLEIEHRGPGGQRISNRVVLPKASRRGPGRLEVRFDRADNVDIHSYKDVDAGYEVLYQPILLPWGSVHKQVYEYRDGHLLLPVPPAKP